MVREGFFEEMTSELRPEIKRCQSLKELGPRMRFKEQMLYMHQALDSVPDTTKIKCIKGSGKALLAEEATRVRKLKREHVVESEDGGRRGWRRSLANKGKGECMQGMKAGTLDFIPKALRAL